MQVRKKLVDHGEHMKCGVQTEQERRCICTYETNIIGDGIGEVNYDDAIMDLEATC